MKYVSRLKFVPQWDSPNAWAPIQQILIEGLYALNTKTAADLAAQLTCAWVHTNFVAWTNAHIMYEKYNALVVGAGGGGGEYGVQSGFGWTNGVILSLLAAQPELNCES